MLALANILTASRILGIIPFVLLLRGGYNVAAFVLFVHLALTDVFDGYFARKSGRLTRWGKFFDPAADKIFFLPATMVLASHAFSPMPQVMLYAFAARCVVEALLFLTAFLAYCFPVKFGKALGANSFGKQKTFGDAVFAVLLLGGLASLWSLNAAPAITMALVLTIFAAASLFGHWKPFWK